MPPLQSADNVDAAVELFNVLWALECRDERYDACGVRRAARKGGRCRPSLLRAFWRAWGAEYAWLGVLKFASDLCGFAGLRGTTRC